MESLIADKDFAYGLLKYSSTNIGDEVQCIAAMRFLPQIDEYVHRDRINRFRPKSGKMTKLIMNAWWLQNIKGFPPSKYIKPLMISMYVRHNMRKRFLTSKVRKYFMENAPVGCRDKSTYEWLKSEKIPAYFSGCLTLTLERNTKIPRGDYILCVDTTQEVVNAVKQRTNRPVYSISRMLTPYCTYEERLRIAKVILRLYHDAHCVVSPRLHVVLPSVAFNTPVLRIIPNNHVDDGRWDGYENLVKTVYEKDFLADSNIYDFDNPPENDNSYLELKKNLIQKVSDFTGYNNSCSLIDEEINPTIELLNCMVYSGKKQKRILYWSRPKQLFKTILRKLFLRKTRWDV